MRIYVVAYSNNNPINYSDPSGYWPVPQDPIQIIRDAKLFLESIGQRVVGDPTVKSIFANGTDIVSQTINAAGEVTGTFLNEVKQTTEVAKGTLGLDKAGTYGGSIDRALRTMGRLANTSNEQLKLEFKAIMEGQQAGNLKNALYTTAGKVSEGAKDVFNYVYMAAADGAVTTVKTAETFVSSTIDLPFLMVPYALIDPKNSPFYNPQIPQ